MVCATFQIVVTRCVEKRQLQLFEESGSIADAVTIRTQEKITGAQEYVGVRGIERSDIGKQGGRGKPTGVAAGPVEVSTDQQSVTACAIRWHHRQPRVGRNLGDRDVP